jgi:hypothetical protein
VVIPSRLATSLAFVFGSAIAAMAIFIVSMVILRGLPPNRPRALAAARPAFVRSRINSASNSARAANMPNIRRPLAVVVSILGSSACKYLKSNSLVV